jgi:HlyD family secretion protein
MKVPGLDRVMKGGLKGRRSLVVLALVGVLGTGGWWVLRAQTPKPERKGGEPQTVAVQSEDLRVRIRASGTVTPIQSVNVSPKRAGRLVKLLVDQGNRVTAGQAIAQMESDDLEAQLAQAQATLQQAEAKLLEAQNGTRSEELAGAEAQTATATANLADAAAKLKQAQDDLERNQKLAQDGVISRNSLNQFVTQATAAQAALEAQKARLNEQNQNLDKLRNGTRPEQVMALTAAVAQAEAQVQAAQVELNNTTIRAPFGGIVTQKYANIGSFVTPTTSASTSASATSSSIVAIASELEIVAKVPETSISQVKRSQSVEIRADAYPGKTFKGTVRLISPEAVVEQNVTSFQVRVRLQSGQSELRSGMNVDLVFKGTDLKDAVVVPTVAIVNQKGKTGVLVAKDGQEPEFRPITIGVTAGDRVQIMEGVQPGESVVVYQALPKSKDSGPPIRFR